MTEEEIRALVREQAAIIMDLDPEELGDDDDFESVGGTSLHRLELVTALSDRLGVRYSLDDEVRMTSVRAAVDVTQRALAG